MHNKFQANFLWKICKNKKKINSRLVCLLASWKCVYVERKSCCKKKLNWHFSILYLLFTVLCYGTGLGWTGFSRIAPTTFWRVIQVPCFMIYWAESYLKHIIIYWMVSFQGSSQLILQKYEYCSWEFSGKCSEVEIFYMLVTWNWFI